MKLFLQNISIIVKKGCYNSGGVLGKNKLCKENFLKQSGRVEAERGYIPPSPITQN